MEGEYHTKRHLIGILPIGWSLIESKALTDKSMLFALSQVGQSSAMITLTLF